MRKIPILTNIFQLGWNHQLVLNVSYSMFFFFSMSGRIKDLRKTELSSLRWHAAGLAYAAPKRAAQLIRHSQEVSSMHSDVNSTISEHGHSQIFNRFTVTLYKQIILQHVFSSLLQWKRTAIWVGNLWLGIYHGGHDLVAEDRIYRVSTQFFAPRLGHMMGTMGRRFVGWVNPAHGRSFWLSKLGIVCVSDTAKNAC